VHSPYFVPQLRNFGGREQGRKTDLLNAMHSTPVDIELAAEAKFECAEEARGFQFLSTGDDAGKGFVGAEPQGILAKNGALI
jgi:hypothetical protein